MKYILVVEHDENVSKFLQVNLLARKYPARFVSDEQTALALIRAESPWLIILDLQSTNDESFIFLDLLGQIVEDNLTCAIVFTTWLSAAQIAYCSLYPYVCEILYKPANATILMNTVKRLWKREI